MDFFEIVAARRSIREYASKPVEDEKLAAILDAARLAPTAHDYQAFRILVIKTEGRRAELKKVYRQEWFSEAPLLLLVCSVPSEAWVRGDGRSYADVDAAIVMDHIVLGATSLKLGTCWVAAFDAGAARELLELEPGWEPVAFTPLGYPKEKPDPRPRKSIGDLVVMK